VSVKAKHIEGDLRSAENQYIFEAMPPAQKFAAAVDICQLVPSQLLNNLLNISNPAHAVRIFLHFAEDRHTSEHSSKAGSVQNTSTQTPPHSRHSLPSNCLANDIKGVLKLFGYVVGLD
jgi:hypothetical protein